METRAAIIIPHRDDMERLEKCLRALCPLPPSVEVCVVDNGSSADLSLLRKAFPWVRLIFEDRPGAAAARNRGVAETEAPLLFFLDCDCVPAPGWAQQALAAAGSADIIGGRVDLFLESGVPMSGAAAFETVFAFDNRSYVQDKDFSVTANLVTTRAVFDQVGPFRPGVSEDVDWCHRAREAGFSLAYDDALRVLHPARSDWEALTRKWRRTTREAFELADGRSPAWLLKAACLPASALVHAPRIFRSHALDSGRARAAALLTLVALRCARGWWMLRLSLGLPI